MAQPSLYVYYHTHWDREWYLPFREYQHRLLTVVDDILTTLESGQMECFTLDGQTVLLEDYLEFRPENESRLRTLVKQNKLSIGPWYVMPDEFLVSGESLIRNLQRGLYISREFGEETFTGYLPDTFGHSADIPMILTQFGISSAIVWRGLGAQFPLFTWQSPSEDQVTAFHLTEGYFQNVFHMGKDLQEKKTFFQQWLSKVSDVVPNNAPVLFPVGADHLGVVADSPALVKQLAPDAQSITPDTFMTLAAESEQALVQTHVGELRNFEGAYLLPGVFSSRMYLKQWNRTLEWRLTRQLEPLLAWSQVLNINLPPVKSQLDFLWKTLLLNHPHDSICGCSVDSVHRENEVRFEHVDQLSTALVRDLHAQLSHRYQPDNTMLVFNLSDSPYTGVVELTQDYPNTAPPPAPEAEIQVLTEETLLDESYLLDTAILPLSENQAVRRKSLAWVENLPAHGLTTLAKALPASDTVLVTASGLENNNVIVQVTPSGDLTVEDRKTKRIYTGIHQLWRNLEQGDSYNAAPVPGTMPTQARIERTEIVDEGPLRGTLALTWTFPDHETRYTTWVSLDAGSPALSFKTTFVNQTPDHKVQVVFKTASPLTQVIAEGHFAPITRSYDPSYRLVDHMPAPRLKELLVQGGPIQRFIGFDDQTLITRGLTEYEVEGESLKLTLIRAFGMLSRDDTGVRGSHAGPPLQTPEGQCLHRAFECHYQWRPGFSLEGAFTQADRFYGAVYGFAPRSNAQEASQATSASTSILSWQNPAVVSTAFHPGPQNTLHLRLLNPTATPQTIVLHLPKGWEATREINLTGKPIAPLQDSSLTIPPYRLTTVELYPPASRGL